MASINPENLNPGTNPINACLGRRYWPDTDERMDAESVVVAVRAYFRREIDANSERTRSERLALCAILPGVWILLFLLLVWMGNAALFTRLTTLLFGVMVTLVCCRDPYAVRRAGAAEILERLEDPALIGAAAGYLNSPDLRVQQAAWRALHKMLPHARAEHVRFIHANEMANIVRIITRRLSRYHVEISWENEMQVAILNAFRYIGTAQAYEPVKALLQDTRPLPRDVAAAASECLPYLEQRYNETRHMQTLLRPADLPDNPDTLLRPAQGAEARLSNHEATQLLRAG